MTRLVFGSVEANRVLAADKALHEIERLLQLKCECCDGRGSWHESCYYCDGDGCVACDDGWIFEECSECANTGLTYWFDILCLSWRIPVSVMPDVVWVDGNEPPEDSIRYYGHDSDD